MALLSASRDWPGPLLWFADEQFHGVDITPLRRSDAQVICNRYDVFCWLAGLGVDAGFSDFDVSSIPTASVSRIGYRVSKEKAAVHHLINTSLPLLAKAGELWLAGAQAEGIRTYLDKAGRLFGNRADMHKQAGVWLGRLQRPSAQPGPWLDNRDYRRLRPIAEALGVTFISKPGVFGWDRIDPGSTLLATGLPDFLKGFSRPPRSLLDLGCGYGYLAAVASRLQRFEQIVATDNNAAALLACEATFEANGIPGTVLASDCGDTLRQPFDLVLCNPPRHRGFGGDRKLTERFLAGCARLLSTTGRALFVVNSFLPLEQRAAVHFRQVATLHDNRRFKLVQLARARAH